MLQKLRSAGRALRRCQLWLAARPTPQLCVTALILELLIESLHRHSPLQALIFLLGSPLLFLYNALIIFTTLTLSLLFKKRDFARMFIAAAWFLLGLIDCIILFFRTTPLAEIDFELLSSVKSIVSSYLSPIEIILACALIAAVFIALIWYAVRSKKKPCRMVREGVLLLLGAIVSVYLCTQMALQTGMLADSFPNLPTAYNSYGFVYCFTSSVVTRGIDRPEDYSQDTMEELLKEIHVDSEQTETKTPNLIFIQLESLIDVQRLKNITVSSDPTPTYNGLKASCSSGLLTVPSIGAGTANTEFEVITGMSLDYFGTGEYPYKTILQNVPCASLCYDLKELGYSSHAIHNHSGSFYDRNRVFANLGFDTFTSMEYMQNVTYTPRGWAQDSCLTDCVMDALNSTDGPDLVYTITVQGHGKYSAKAGTYGDLPYSVTSGMDDPDENYAFSYYMTQINGTDQFVQELLTILADDDEPTVVVMYGDHLPTFSIKEEDLSNGTLFDTEYVMWSNFEMEPQNKDLNSYQLGSYVLGRLGIDNGVMTKLHQRYASSPKYQSAMELLEYDMLYGEQDVYQGAQLQPTQLQMGVHPVRLSTVEAMDNNLLVIGDNFTYWSQIFINGKKKDTVYIDPYMLEIKDWVPDEDCSVTVHQVGKDYNTLSTTADFAYRVADTPQITAGGSTTTDDIED